jgi:hypothetical protein
MSEKQEQDNVISLSKSQMRRIAKEQNKEMPVTDEEFDMFMEAFFGVYKGPGYNPE